MSRRGSKHDDREPTHPWWSGLNEQDLTVRLVQCDLANHSKWFRQCAESGSLPLASEARKKLAEAIGEEAKPFGFDRVFWRGDGGLFAAQQRSTSADQTVIAAHAVREAFLRWQQLPAYRNLGLARLALRISCHSCVVWAGPDTEYWSSDDLNLFTKFERDIAHRDAIAVTQHLKQYLVDRKTDFEVASKQVLVREQGEDAPAQFWMVSYDATVSQSRPVKDAVQWFMNRCGATHDSTLVAESQRFTVGDSIVVHIPSSPMDSLDIEFAPEASDVGFKDLEELAEWKQYEDDILASFSRETGARKRLDNLKVSPTRLRIPLQDFPLAKITYTPIRFSRARAFLKVLENDSNGVWARLAGKGVDYEENALLRPGMAGAHLVLITKNPKPMVILAQRSLRQDPKTRIQAGQWSASCEETMTPSDGSIEGTARRGLEEELLAKEAERTSIRAAGIFIERRHLSLCIAMVCHTDLSLDEIVECWRRCVDHDEHSQVVGLPVNAAVIKGCIEANELTNEARGLCHVVDEGRWKNTVGWQLVSTSAFRLGLALWTLEV